MVQIFAFHKNSPPPLLKYRVYAFLFDLTVIFALSKVVMFTFLQFLNDLPIEFSTKQQLLLFYNFPLYEHSLQMSLIFSYFLLSYFLAKGQSWGKMLFKLKVYSKTNNELTFSECSLRALGYTVAITIMPPLFIIPFLHKKEEGLPEWLSNTCVKREIKNKSNIEKQIELNLDDQQAA